MTVNNTISSAKTIAKNSNSASEIKNILDAYDAVCTAEEKIDTIETDIKDVIPKKFDPCVIQEKITKLNEIRSTVESVSSVMTSSISSALSGAAALQSSIQSDLVNGASQLAAQTQEETKREAMDEIKKEENEARKDIAENENTQLIVDQKYTALCAVQIILKKYQMLKYRLESVKVTISLIVAQFTKAVLMDILNGKGSSVDPINQQVVSSISSAAQTANRILTITSSIVSAINSLLIMNVNGAAMAFFMTPKSMIKTDIPIINSNMSTTNSIPPIIDQAITKAENATKELNGKTKKARIIAMGAQGAITAAAGKFDPGVFGTLERIDPSKIRQAVNAIIQTLTDAEALPRYEKLSVSNVRFLFFLVTGFEPAGKRSFGIPGFP